MRRHTVGAAALLAVLLAGVTTVAAQPGDSRAAREQAAKAYLAAVPLETMLAEAVDAIARQVPEPRRAEFVTLMKKFLRVDVLNAMTTDLLIKHFTVSEIDALTRFYGSPEGASIMRKFGPYMGDLMPRLQSEILRAVQDVKTEMKI